MTHYWIYIATGATIDENTKFYKIGVGTSHQCQRDFAFLSKYAADHGHYLSLTNYQTSEFLMKVIKSIKKDLSCIRFMPIRDLVRSIRQSNDVPLSQDCLHNQHQLNVQINLEYRISCRNRRK